MVSFLFVSVTKLPKKKQSRKKLYARIWVPYQMRALKNQNATITLWVTRRRVYPHFFTFLLGSPLFAGVPARYSERIPRFFFGPIIIDV